MGTSGAQPGDESMEACTMKIEGVIIDRNEAKCWSRIGVAFTNADGSREVTLEAIPISGEMLIRDEVPREAALRAPSGVSAA